MRETPSGSQLTEPLQARSEWHDIYDALEQKDLQPRILYPTRLSLIFQGEIKQFPDKCRLKKLITTKPALQDILKGLL